MEGEGIKVEKEGKFALLAVGGTDANRKRRNDQKIHCEYYRCVCCSITQSDGKTLETLLASNFQTVRHKKRESVNRTTTNEPCWAC